MNKATIETRIHAAIRPQLDRADELLDYYLQDAPPEVWEPIAFQVAADHYSQVPLRFIPGSFSDVINRINETVRKLAQITMYPAFHQDHVPEWSQ